MLDRHYQNHKIQVQAPADAHRPQLFIEPRSLSILLWTGYNIAILVIYLFSFIPVALIVGLVYEITFHILIGPLVQDNYYEQQLPRYRPGHASAGSEDRTIGRVIITAIACLLHALFLVLKLLTVSDIEWMWAVVFGWLLCGIGFLGLVIAARAVLRVLSTTVWALDRVISGLKQRVE